MNIDSRNRSTRCRDPVDVELNMSPRSLSDYSRTQTSDENFKFES